MQRRTCGEERWSASCVIQGVLLVKPNLHREADEIFGVLAKVLGSFAPGTLAEALQSSLRIVALLKECASLGGGPLADLAFLEVLGELGSRPWNLVLVAGADEAALWVRHSDEEVGRGLTVLGPGKVSASGLSCMRERALISHIHEIVDCLAHGAEVDLLALVDDLSEGSHQDR